MDHEPLTSMNWRLKKTKGVMQKNQIGRRQLVVSKMRAGTMMAAWWRVETRMEINSPQSFARPTSSSACQFRPPRQARRIAAPLVGPRPIMTLVGCSASARRARHSAWACVIVLTAGRKVRTRLFAQKKKLKKKKKPGVSLRGKKHKT